MLFQARNHHRKIAELQPVQSDNHPFEMINEPRLKTELYITYVLSVLFVFKIYIEKFSDGHFTIDNAGTWYRQQFWFLPCLL